MEVKKRVAARGKKMKRSADDHTSMDVEEEKVGKSVVERCISTPIPNHLSTSLSPPMPNHLSTYLTTLLQNKATPHIFKTIKPLIEEYNVPITVDT